MQAKPDEIEWLLAQRAWMRSLALDLLGDRGLAEDVVQDAWAAALARGPREAHARGPRAWLAGVVGNLARRTRGREARRGAIEEHGARAEAQASAAELVARMELQQHLAEAVLALDEPYRSAVLWRHLEGLSAHAIATRQGCSETAARQRIARGLERLRRALDARHGPRSAWSLTLAPLAAQAAATVLPAAIPIGGLLMGSKLVVVTVAGLALAVLAFVTFSERTSDGPRPAEVAREVALARQPVEHAPSEALTPTPSAREASAPPARANLVLTGFVHAPDGWPLSGAHVACAADEAAAEALVTSGLADERWTNADEVGRFRLSLRADSRLQARVWVLRAGYFSERVDASAALERGETLDVLLHARPALEIVLHAPPEATLPNAVPTEARLWLRPADGSEVTVEVKPDERGQLFARDLPPGRLERVRARMRGFGRVERALDLALVPDGLERVELELPYGATLSGIVLDARTEQPIAGADVWAEDSWLLEEHTAPSGRCDEHGRFELTGVDLTASDGPVRVSWCLVSAQAKGYVAQRFDLRGWQTKPANRYWAEVRLQPADARLDGVVFLPDGRAARATVLAVDARGEIHVQQTDEQGTFRLEGLAWGALELTLQTPEGDAHAALRTTLELHEGETRVSEFRLEIGQGVVAGHLRDARGAPLAGVELTLDQHMVTSKVAFVAQHRTTSTDAAGRFEFSACPPGQHLLTLGSLPGGLVPEAGPGNFSLAVGETRTVDLICAAPMELGGRIELDGRDPADLRVVAFARASGANLAESVVAADGAFLFPRLYPTRVDLAVLAGERELSRTSVGPAGARDLRLPLTP